MKWANLKLGLKRSTVCTVMCIRTTRLTLLAGMAAITRTVLTL